MKWLEITNGKNKEILRTLFKEQTKKEPLTSKGNLSQGYIDFLKKECKPHWASVLTKFGSKIEDIEEGKIKPLEVLEEARNKTILEEKCSLGIGGKIASNKRLWEEKYGIKF